MADITINGVEIIFDMEAVTIAEYRAFAKGSMMEEEDDVLLAKVAGMNVDDVRALSHPNYRRLLKGFFDKAREPLADPN
jgi:hypothetical protein